MSEGDVAVGDTSSLWARPCGIIVVAYRGEGR